MGRTPIPEMLRNVTDLTHSETRKIIAWAMEKNEAELTAYANDGLLANKYRIFARLVLSILHTHEFTSDDIKKLEFILDRASGKVPENEPTQPVINQFRSLPTPQLLDLAEQEIKRLRSANEVIDEARPAQTPASLYEGGGPGSTGMPE